MPRLAPAQTLAAAWFFCGALLCQTGAIADAPPVSFVNDVQPILTRYGCNAGACHGKLAGQNGFRLSLRGYAPEDDHRSLVQEEFARRINPIDPAQSLLLLKAIGQLPHGGGKLFAADSAAYGVLKRWIGEGVPGIIADEPRVVSIETSPNEITLQPNDHRTLVVQATYSDNTVRDVTWLSQFHSNDASFASVAPTGEVQAHRNGEVSLMVAFQGLVDTVVLSMPFQRSLEPALFANRNHFIDDHVMDKLQTLQIAPSELCDDATYLRRVMLDLIGTLPTAEEVQQFVADQSTNKRAELVDSLMSRPELVDYWTLQIGDLLQNRKERDHDVRGAKGVRGMHAWLRNQIQINRPWNELAYEVLTASGSTSQNPAVGYYVVTVGEKQAHESEVADSVAQSFLAARIGCAKCHNHPLEKYTQDDYYHFIAFFAHVMLDRKSPSDGATVLFQGTRHLQNLEKRLSTDEGELNKLRSEGGDAKQIEDKEKRLTQLKDEIKRNREATPSVNQPRTGKSLGPQTLDRTSVDIATATDPRAALATWMISPENKAFAGSMVNRLWKHFFAVGLVEPVDDMRDTNPPTNAPLLDALVKELIDSGYDLRHLMKMMVTSRTYQLASDTTSDNANDTRFYSHYYAKRLPAEVLLDALVQATGVPDSFPGYPQGTRAIRLPGPQIDSYFLTTFGRSERVTACACERSDDVTLSQLLHLQNSDNLLNKFRDPTGNLLQWVNSSDSADQLIDKLFLNTFSRFPSESERADVLNAFTDQDRAEVAHDLFWALLNAKEFAFNH